MDTLNKAANKMKPIRCLLGFHRYHKIKNLFIGGELVECSFCKEQICVHHGRQQAILYDADIQEAERQIKHLLEKYS